MACRTSARATPLQGRTRGLRLVSRPSRGSYHEHGSVWPTRRLDLVASDRGRDRPGAGAYELPEVVTLEEARRPTKKMDGSSITMAEEVKLWRQAMDFFHDIKSDDEDDDEDEEEEEPEKDESLELAPDAAGKSLAASAAKASVSAVPKAKADAAMEGAGPPRSGPPHALGLQSLLQMTCGRSSSPSIVRTKSHWLSFCCT